MSAWNTYWLDNILFRMPTSNRDDSSTKMFFGLRTSWRAAQAPTADISGEDSPCCLPMGANGLQLTPAISMSVVVSGRILFVIRSKPSFMTAEREWMSGSMESRVTAFPADLRARNADLI
jgi:hypothetical protein